MLDPDLVEAPLGDVLDRAFIADQAAILAVHGARILGDPDDIAVLSIDLRLESGHRATRLHDVHEFVAPVFLDVELAADVTHPRHQLLGRFEAVDVSERRIRIEELPIRGGAEDALDRIVEKPVVTPLRLAQRMLGMFALRDVLDQPFQSDGFAVLIRYAGAAFPDPARRPIGMHDAVLEIECAALFNGAPDRLAYPHAILWKQELTVGEQGLG